MSASRQQQKNSVIIVFFLFILLWMQNISAITVPGKVLDTLGIGIPGAMVELFDASTDMQMYSIQTDGDGAFVFTDIVDISYYVEIATSEYSLQYWAPETNTLYPQYPIEVSDNDSLILAISGSPFDNPPNNSITVHVIDSTGTTLTNPDIYITLIRELDGRESGWRGVQSDGTVTFDSLHPASYAIYLGGADYPYQYLNTPINTSYPGFYVSVDGGQTLTKTMIPVYYPIGEGAIAVVCLDETGNPLDGVIVSLCEPFDTNKTLYSQQTDIDGRLLFENISEMSYFLKLEKQNYPDQWYSIGRNQTTRYPDDDVYPMITDDTLFIRLSSDPIDNPPAASVRIQVFDENGMTITNETSIELIDESNTIFISPGFDSATQSLLAEGIPLGNYLFKCNHPSFPVQYYSPGGNTINPGFYVSITMGMEHFFEVRMSKNPDGTGTTNSYLSGTLYDETGSSAAGATVCLFDVNRNIFDTLTTDNNGAFYRISIPAQPLIIAVDYNDYPRQYWSQNGMTASMNEDNYAWVSAGEEFYIDAYLSYSPENRSSYAVTNTTVEGTVYDVQTGNPLSGVRVVLIDFEPQNDMNLRNLWSGWTTSTDASGRFYLYDVPGKFHIVAEADSLNYIAQFFPGTDFFNESEEIIIDSNQTTLTLEFKLRKGGILKGLVTDENGKPVQDAWIDVRNEQDTRWFSSGTGSDGTWKIAGIPGGTWHVWVGHNAYLPVDEDQERKYDVTEGTAISVPTFKMKAGGHLQGTFTAPFSMYDTSNMLNYWNNCFLYFDTSLGHGHTIWPHHHTGLHFEPSNTDGTGGTFRSDVIEPGTYYFIYSPQPDDWDSSTQSANRSIIPGTGYSFIGSTDASRPGKSYTISADDTLTALTLSLREGYSIFGTLHYEDGSRIYNNFGVEAMKRVDSDFLIVSYATIHEDGRFELPGLIDEEDYYLVVWADGYPHQFWSPDGNTSQPSTSFHFDAQNYTPLELNIEWSPDGIDPNQVPSPINLWVEDDSSGHPLLVWDFDQRFSFYTFSLFSSDREGKVVKLASVDRPASTNRMEFRDNREINDWYEYVIVGEGDGIKVRSHITGYDPRYRQLISTEELWLDVFGNRYGIQLDWGGEDMNYNENDSVSLFRRVGTDPFKLIHRRSAWDHWMYDHAWDDDDRGKTYTYYVEIPTRNQKSSPVTFTLDDAFFSQLVKTLHVGPYEQYRTISEAIAAAGQYDHIEVQPGTYKENISLMGKYVSINGHWDYGKPPVIDGGGGTAFTVPVCKAEKEWNRPNISGFHIRNSAIGVKSYYNVEVNECLFENVTIALSMAIDSSALVQNLYTNPFAPNIIEGHVYRCTFIAGRSGSLIASTAAAGIAQQPSYDGTYAGREQYYITPAVLLSSRVNVDRCNIAFYESVGLQTTIPFKISSNNTYIDIAHSNFYKTSKDLHSPNIHLNEEITEYNPQFVDETSWFIDETSPLAGTDWDSWIGYDIRHFDKYNDKYDENRPSAIKDVQATVVGLTAVVVKWSASPVTENISRYMVYRIPGDPSLFYINQESQWDLKISEDSIFTVIDSFSTTQTAFMDTTVEVGKAYLYVVAAVNDESQQGDIELPAPPDIATYFTNTIGYSAKFTAGKWHMTAVQGADSQALSSNSPHVLYEWDDKRVSDKLLAQYKRVSSFKPGKGYWFKPVQDTTITFSKASLASLRKVESSLSVALKKGTTGWNMISSPFPFAIIPDWFSTYTAWEWNVDSLSYRRASVLKPWKAYWIHTEKDTSLPIWKRQQLSYYISNSLAKTAAGTPQWQLQLSLRSKACYDTDNFIGVLSTAAKRRSFSTPEPPNAFGASRLYIIDHLAEKNTGEQLAFLYKSAQQSEKLEWMIGISPTEERATVQVDNIDDVPDHYFVFWISENTVINLRETDTVAIAPGNSERFGYIVVTDNPAILSLYTGRLALHTPYPNPFRGSATINFTLPYFWGGNGSITNARAIPLELTLYNLSGKCIRNLVNEKYPPGVYAIRWNGNNNNGGQVATGMFILRLRYGTQQKHVRLYRIK